MQRRSSAIPIDRIPTAVGDYRVEERLGGGGQCDVYRARHGRLGRYVALKLLRCDLVADDVHRERFLREARACARLCHPNIVEVFDVGVHDGRPYMAMELVEGGDLRSVLLGDSPLRWRLETAAALADALDAAHREGVVHRDLKPENVLLDRDGNVKVADWGLAKLVREKNPLTVEGTFLGTPSYVAPEQVRREPVTTAADLYALGVLVFELVAGRPPFIRQNLVELLRAHLDEQPPRLRTLDPTVPAALSRLVDGLLAKSPADRPSSAAAVAARLRSVARNLQHEHGPCIGATRVAVAEHKPRERGMGSLVAAFVAAIVMPFLVGARPAAEQAVPPSPPRKTAPAAPATNPDIGAVMAALSPATVDTLIQAIVGFRTGRTIIADELPSRVERLLANVGVGAAEVAAIRSHLAQMHERDRQDTAAEASFLEPLRKLNVALASLPGVTPPWGLFDEALGIRFKSGDIPPRRLLPWQNAAVVSLTRLRDGGSRSRGGRKVLWQWLAPVETLQASVNRSPKAFTNKILLESHGLVTSGEVLPSGVREMASSRNIVFVLKPEAIGSWPPEAAALDLRLKSFDRSLSLLVEVNGTSPVRIFDMWSPEATDSRAYLKPTWVTVPIDAGTLIASVNTVKLTVERIPGIPSMVDQLAVELATVVCRTRKEVVQ